MTGNDAEYGELFRLGATFAISVINDRGGINGRPVELVIEDSRSDPREAILIAQRFISNPAIVGVVGDFNSSTSMAAAPLYTQAGLVLISPSASHPDFTSIGPYIFRSGTTQELEGIFLANWAVRDLGRRRIAILFVNNDWGVVTSQIFSNNVRSLGGQIVESQNFIPGDRDFTASLTRIRAANPDLLFIATQWADASLIAMQAENLGLRVDLMGTGGIAQDVLIQNAGMAIEGARANAQYFVGDPRPPARFFTEGFQNMFPHVVRVAGFSALTYDAVNLLAEGIRVGGRDRTRIREAMAAIRNFPGATGMLTFYEDRTPHKEFNKLRVINQSWQVSPE
jgi:branched-chain amino acid transport system substrate-binding protein